MARSSRSVPLLVAAVLALAFGTGLAAGQALPSLYPALPADAGLEAELLLETNHARRAHGLAPLVPDERLALAARHHSAEMADLGYLSHRSPVPAHETLARRVARAGSPLSTLGENLARFVGESDVPRAAVDGWLASPGHRANLLSGEFTHVGFGVARSDGGAVVVTQVLARRPVRLVYAAVRPEERERLELELTVRAREPVRAAFTVGNGNAVSRELAAGEHRLRLVAEPAALVQVLAGVESAPGSGFVVTAAGWLEPATGSWRPDESARGAPLEIVEVRPVARRVRVALVTLEYDGAGARELAVFVDDAYVPEAFQGLGRIELALPLDGDAVIRVGEIGADRQARIFNTLTLGAGATGPRLTAGGG